MDAHAVRAFPGFEPFPFYPGYSANFFDGKHFVMKGGSPRTAACMLRRSFRNWFQPHYPYVYAVSLREHVNQLAKARETMHADPRRCRPTFEARNLAGDVRAGLAAGQKELPSKYLYDEVGSALFEVISVLPEYGLTRADERLLRRHAADIVARLPMPIAVAELGSGSGKKTRWLLEALARRQRTPTAPSRFRPPRWRMCKRNWARSIASASSDSSAPISTACWPPPPAATKNDHLLVLFLGSTIGNFDRDAGRAISAEVRRILFPGDCPAARHGSGKTAPAIARGLRRSAGRYGRVQPESSGAHQSRAGRGFRSRPIRARGEVQPASSKRRNAPALEAGANGDHQRRRLLRPLPSR